MASDSSLSTLTLDEPSVQTGSPPIPGLTEIQHAVLLCVLEQSLEPISIPDGTLNGRDRTNIEIRSIAELNDHLASLGDDKRRMAIRRLMEIASRNLPSPSLS